MAFVDFVRGTAGRLLRIVAGLALIVVGLAVVGGAGGVVIAVLGPVCLLGPLFGVSLWGGRVTLV